MSRREVVSLMSLVCAIVRYYLKKNPSVNIQKGYGGLKVMSVNITKGLVR